MIKAAIFGYGTVGSGVYEVLTRNSAMIQGKLGDRIEVKYVLDLREFPGDPVQDVLVHDVNTILDDEEVSIICETMGGEKPAYDFTRRALELGKSVCTSNKELVEKHGAELLKIAQEHHCSYLFEASVGGGIPIIRPLCTSLAQERIESITGILNGTTNYILSKMENEGADFETVLKRAQEKGYAERNPEADVCGYDAGRKIAILTSLAYGKNVDFADLYVEGITQITRMDFAYAKKLGTTIKLFAKSQCIDGKYYAMAATALNLCNLKGKIVLLPAIHGLVAAIKEDNELQNCYLIAQPSDLISIDTVTPFKDYVIDFAYYDIFKKHVSDFIKKERPRDYWKWFKFDRGLY